MPRITFPAGHEISGPGDRPNAPQVPLEVMGLMPNSSGQSASRLLRIFPIELPTAFLTTINSRVPVEFSTLSSFHNFNLQISGAILVQTEGDHQPPQTVVPGHCRLIPAGEPFRAVVLPTPGLVTLQARVSPLSIAEVRNERFYGRQTQSYELEPLLGEWNASLRNKALRLAEALRFFGTSDGLMIDQHLQSLHFDLASGCHLRVFVRGPFNERTSFDQSHSNFLQA